MLKRVIVKVSGEALAGAGGAFCDETAGRLAAQFGKALAGGTQLALVVGGGNLWRGRSASPWMDRVKADKIGMLATLMNAVYLSESLRRAGITSVVMAPVSFGGVNRVFDKDEAFALMRGDTVIINAAGLWHPYFSTDTVTALRGLELECDCVLYTKSGVGGVYDKDPGKHADARMYKTLSYKTAVAEQLGFADTAALLLSAQNGMPSFVFGADERDGIARVCGASPAEAGFGTFIDNDVREEFYVGAHATL
jgi:uridylate kinase